MNWEDYLDQHERAGLERQSRVHYVKLVRKAVFSGLLSWINRDRATRNLPTLRLPPASSHLHPPAWVDKLNGLVDAAILRLDDATGQSGSRTVARAEEQMETLKQQAQKQFDHLKQKVTGLFIGT